ncbi:MAG: hypothetical protein OEM47_03090 [Deltaproteobacteria bacterium]|nr:hypothetical protein [Deltaproteobacteria bacterium]
MVKRINALIPDEMHRALRVKLAEDGTNFSDWLRARIEEYVGEGGENVKSQIVSPPVPTSLPYGRSPHLGHPGSEQLPRLERRRKKREG